MYLHMDLSTSTPSDTLTDLQRRVFLAVGDPAVSHFGTAIARAVGTAASNVYVVLRRLEDFGLVREEWHPQSIADESGRRHRRTYVLTEYGTHVLSL